MSDSERPPGEASLEDAEVPRESSEDAAEDFHPFDEIDEEYGGPQPGVYVVDSDGMPTEVDRTQESDIPALSKDTLVCMEDRSSFVLRDGWGEILVRFEPQDVEQAPDGRWRVPVETAWHNALYARWGFPRPLTLLRLWVAEKLGGFIEVEPIRPKCRHYVRQKTQFELNPSGKIHLRLCAARRTTEGAMASLRDTGMWACSMRDPVDLSSQRALEEFDRMKEEQGRYRQHLPIVGASDEQDDDEGTGIFSGKG